MDHKSEKLRIDEGVAARLQQLRHRAELFGDLRRILASPEMHKTHSREEMGRLLHDIDTRHVLSSSEISEFAEYMGMEDAAGYSLGRRHLIQRFKFEEDSENTRIAALTRRASVDDELGAAAEHELAGVEDQLAKAKAALAARQAREKSLFDDNFGGKRGGGFISEDSNDVGAAMDLLEAQRRQRNRNEISSRLHSSSGMSIFLSAVSAQFQECREALSRDLRAIGNHVQVQEDFQQGPSTLIMTLQNYVARCDRVICLVGSAYGLEPSLSALPSGSPRRSYSQWEYFFAIGERINGPKMPRKELFVYIATDQFLARRPVQESTELADRQQAFIRFLKGSGEDHRSFDSIDHLCRMVLRDGWQLAGRPNL